MPLRRLKNEPSAGVASPRARSSFARLALISRGHEDRKRLKNLREQYIALSKEVEDVRGRLLARKQMPGS
jgi:hypothetical protein